MKRILTIFTIAVVSFGTLSNCFGKFGLVKTVYGVNAGINIGSGIVARFFRTFLMYLPGYIFYGVAYFLDLVLFNLIEFWTNSNPIAMAEYDFDGKLVKEFNDDKGSVRLTYMKFGKELKIEATVAKNTETFYAFSDKPGKLFQVKGNEMVELKETEGPIPYLSPKSI
ncbi:DUF3332 family protein [Leptospira ognonensis]|uniref:DUF3332 family protein n=1 Tax=Leptospira ognonensis TaxID=2484945 RepID=A0A4R9K3W2_9LEPT|nr:DUF3332 family protein [Leptospira ognonensis]TGL60116.1 DUF3332 family protein [Leptospira ognonensis]